MRTNKYLLKIFVMVVNAGLLISWDSQTPLIYILQNYMERSKKKTLSLFLTLVYVCPNCASPLMCPEPHKIPDLRKTAVESLCVICTTPGTNRHSSCTGLHPLSAAHLQLHVGELTMTNAKGARQGSSGYLQGKWKHQWPHPTGKAQRTIIHISSTT